MSKPAQTAREKFQELLRELFQVRDAAELDFGIYRIMGQKRGLIEKLIDEELLASIDAELRTGSLKKESAASAQVEELAAQIRENLADDAIDAEGNLDAAYAKTKLGKDYRAAQKASGGGRSMTELEGTIYNHLYDFFSRYYDKGDFMSLRRYSKREKYAIPYNGEEAHLHWANADQYYIKTGETFTDYRWKDPAGMVRVKFAVTRATVPKDNIKAPDKRHFIPQLDEIEVETVGTAKDKDRHVLLTLPFHYRGFTEDETKRYAALADERGIKNGSANGGKLQAAILAGAGDEIPKAEVVKASRELMAALAAEHHKDADGNPVSWLAHHLRRFTVRNTSDYFIHKDLGGFLTRELDFFLKNEVLHLDNLEAGGEERAEGWFEMMRVIRRIGSTIIDFLAQIENFQKRLFEKKKFVTECHYVVTLDRIPEELYPKIAKNKAQVEEWRKLFAIEEVEGWSEPPTVNFLRRQCYLPVDSALFYDSPEIGDELKANAGDSSLVVNADNYHALSLLLETLKGRVSCAYIDPPYNTEQDRATGKFLYKDSYDRSSWMAFVADRVRAIRNVLEDRGVLFSSIDEFEVHRLLELLSSEFANRVGIFTWVKKKKGSHLSKLIRDMTEYVVAFCDRKDGLELFGEKAYGDKPQPLAKRTNKPKELKFPGLSVATTLKDGYYPQGVYGRGSSALTFKNGFNVKKGVVVEEMLVKGPFVWSQVMLDKELGGGSKAMLSREFGFNVARSGQENRVKRPTTILDSKVGIGTNEDGSQEILELFNREGIASYPKPVSLVKYLIRSVLIKQSDSVVLDAFGGSGTTGEALISLNRDDGGDRTSVLIEMGFQCEELIVPRLKKVAYARDWAEGKPTSHDAGISHCFKYLRLESYEDALGNIAFNENEAAQKQLAFDQYLIHYMLDFETSGSETLLNTDELVAPFDYKLEIREGDELKVKPVDLPETFNFLIGLRVRTRRVHWREVKKRGKKAEKIKYLVLRGCTNPHATGGEREVVVIWRTTQGWTKEDYTADREFIDALDLTKDADEVFYNDDSFLRHPNSKSLDPIFKRRMFNQPD